MLTVGRTLLRKSTASLDAGAERTGGPEYVAGPGARSGDAAGGAMGGGDEGEAEEAASCEAAGDGVPAAGGGVPVVAVAVGGAVAARGAGEAALPGGLPPQAGSISIHAASGRQIGGRTNMVVAPILAPLVLASASLPPILGPNDHAGGVVSA